MDIDGRYYCTGCMLKIETEDICPYCGYDHNNEQSQSCDLEINTVLQNRYRLGSVLDRDDFSITYIAWDEAMETPIAIKEYYPHLLVTRDVRYFDDVKVSKESEKQYMIGKAHFLWNAGDLGKIEDSDETIRMQKYFEENNTAYIVMEYIRGVSPKDYIEKYKAAPKQLFEQLENLRI